MDQLPNISLEFLEENLGKKVESFEIRQGTKPGDNYMSNLFSLDVKLNSEEPIDIENVHLLTKCYPAHLTRQEFLNKSNMFWNELSAYSQLIPELEAASKKKGVDTKLDFPPFVGGKAINYRKLREIGDNSYIGKTFGSMENYIMMTDMRKTWGFRMADRQATLDMDHISLVIKAYARLHALSWAYKKQNGLNSISEHFPFLKIEDTKEFYETWIYIMDKNIDRAAEIIEGVLGKDSMLYTGTLGMKKFARDILNGTFNYEFTEELLNTTHRIHPTGHQENEARWRVVLHGDCWINNLLFRYDESNLKPVDVVLVDLQMMREHCPTFDIAYLLYTTTTTQFRKHHLKDVLALYYQEFTNICNSVGVEPLPDFTLEELHRRFHRSKSFGYVMATMALPVALKDGNELVDMETVTMDNLTDMFSNISNISGRNTIYTERLLSLAQELYDDGVI